MQNGVHILQLPSLIQRNTNTVWFILSIVIFLVVGTLVHTFPAIFRRTVQEMAACGNTKMQEEMNSIPLADDDPQAIIQDDTEITEMSQISENMMHGQSLDSIPSTFTNGSSSPGPNSLDPDISPDEKEEKARLIAQVLELQNTLDDLSQRVDSVKEENLKLRSENQVLGQYIENLMSASSVFQSTSPKTRKKGSTKVKK